MRKERVFDCIAVKIPLLFVSLYIAATFAGALRAVSGCSLTSASFVALLIPVGCLFFPARLFHKGNRARLFLALILAGGGALFFFEAMYSPAFHGLVSTGGGDAADHLYRRLKFINELPDMYHGFVSFYVMTSWAEGIFHLNAFESYRLVYYASGVMLFLILGVLAFRFVMTKEQDKDGFVLLFFVLIALLGVLPLDRVFLPLLSYLQGEGFYPHVLGFLPLFLAVTVYSWLCSPFMRVAALFLCLLLYRYTYSLNLPDFLLVFAFCVFQESRKAAHGSIRGLGSVAGGLCAAAALYCFSLLLPLAGREGGIVEYNLCLAIVGNGLLGLLLIASPWALKRAGAHKEGAFSRACFFSGSFVIISSFAACVYILSGLPQEYYIYKYTLHVAGFVTPLAVIVAAFLLANVLYGGLRWRSSQRVLPCALMIGFFLGLSLQKFSYELFRFPFEDRRQDPLQAHFIGPLADLGAWGSIEKTLREEQKKMGGFVATPDWALSGFMNAAFSYYHYDELRLHDTGKLRFEPGHCVFWNSKDEDYREIKRVGNALLARRLERLARRPEARAEQYSVGWDEQEKEITSFCIEK